MKRGKNTGAISVVPFSNMERRSSARYTCLSSVLCTHCKKLTFDVNYFL